MAVDDLDVLREQVPEVFKDFPPPPGWDDDWLIVPIDKPESMTPADYERLPDERVAPNDRFGDTLAPLPDLGTRVSAEFPGVLQRGGWGGAVPPPDAYAFYLPFHYFYPRWWGIYLILERVHELAADIRRRSDHRLEHHEALIAVRIFLYAHEAFHHIVESFATRLEVTHRVPLYKAGFHVHFQSVFGTDECLEEALATAHGYRRVKEKAFPKHRRKRAAALRALDSFIADLPPGYRRAREFYEDDPFIAARSALAEENHVASISGVPAKDPPLWLTFPHAFSGIAKVTSRVNYVVRRDSSLAARLDLNLRYLRYEDLSDKLRRLAGCRVVREGRGSHEIWEAPNGHRFPVPKHPSDFGPGLLSKIVKQAGLQMSVSEFVRA